MNAAKRNNNKKRTATNVSLSSRRKLMAFTLTEIVVVLVISTIVAGMAFSVLRVVQRNIDGITSNYDRKTSIKQLEQALVVGFANHSEIYWNEQKQQLQLASPLSQKTFSIQDNLIIGDAVRYNLVLTSKKLYWKGVEVQKGRVDALVLQFAENSPVQRIFVTQPIDPSSEFTLTSNKSYGH